MPKGNYQAGMGMTGANSGGTYEGAGSAGYTGSGTTYTGSGSFTSNTESWNTYESPGSSTKRDEDSVMSSGHGEMSTSQGGSTYERMQDVDPTVHPRSIEGDYQARRDFLNQFDDYDRDFRSDWETHYRDTGVGYERYRPAYQYGWQLGEQYQGRAWNDFAASARTDWEKAHPDDAWEDMKDAVEHAWNRVNGGARHA
jgi:hypothetical protein